jgi:hypothetical protein
VALPSPRAAVAVTLATALVAGCYNFAQPSFNPGTPRQLLLAVTRRAEKAEAKAGESACSDPSLIANALHLTVTATDDTTPRDVWVYSFREKGWDATKTAVDACQAEYAAAHPGAAITRIDVPIYRVFGADWSPGLIEAVRDGLKEAANSGIPGS